MGWPLFWTAVGGTVNAIVLPFVVQFVKRWFPWFKGPVAMWLVWAICCVAAAIQLAVQGALKPIVWSDPITATTAVLGLGSAISQVAQTLYRSFEPFFKQLEK